MVTGNHGDPKKPPAKPASDDPKREQIHVETDVDIDVGIAIDAV